MIIFFSTLSSKGGNNVSGINIKVECNPNASVDSLFTVDYIVTYEGKDVIDLNFIFDKNDEKLAKFLFFNKTAQKSNITSDGGNGRNIKVSHEDVWSATWRALKPGKFESPGYSATVRNSLRVDTLDIPSICKTIKISNTDRKIVKQKEKEKREALKAGKRKDNILALAEVEEKEYEVGDTIHCKLYLLNKVTDPKSDVNNVAIDKSLAIKECSYEIMWFDEVSFDEVESKGNQYQKIGFAEVKIVPNKKGIIEIPKIKLYGSKAICMNEKDKYWGNLPVIIDTYQYNVFTNPLKIFIK